MDESKYITDEEYDKKELYNMIENLFINYDGTLFDTPIMEEKNMYDGLFENDVFLKIENNKIMRYDLNVPFIFYAMRNNISLKKRYSFNKIYKKYKEKDKTKYIESNICVFNMFGHCDSYLQEFEIMNLIIDVSNIFFEGNFTIKINIKNVFHQLFESQIPDNKIKLFNTLFNNYRYNLDEFKSHLYEENFDKQAIDNIISKINEIRSLDDEIKKLEYLKDFDTQLLSFLINDDFLRQYLVIDPLFYIDFDLYNDIIYEVIVNNSPNTIAFGGKCDDYINKKFDKKLPFISISFDLDKIYKLIKQKNLIKTVKRKIYYVASVGTRLDKKRLEVTTFIRNKGYYTKTNYEKNPKIRDQIKEASEFGADYIVLLDRNVYSGKLQIRDMKTNKQILINICSFN